MPYRHITFRRIRGAWNQSLSIRMFGVHFRTPASLVLLATIGHPWIDFPSG